jgi:hypothetical protein
MVHLDLRRVTITRETALLAHHYRTRIKAESTVPFTVQPLTLQLRAAFEVDFSGGRLMASSPCGPRDDEGGLDPSLG